MLRYLLFYSIFYHCAILYSSSKEHQKDKESQDKSLSTIVPYSENGNPSKPLSNLKNFDLNYRNKPLFINNVSLDFTPNRLYAQVRHRDIVKRLPRGHILDKAKTDEEQENINRLRAVVKKQKINTYYTEEGYEDAAYDHAGHIRDADFDEKYNTDVSKKIVPRKNKNNENYKNDDDDDDNFNESVEFKKSDDVFPHYDFFHTWEESGKSPQKFTESEIWKLERDLIEKNRHVADNAETEIPENSRYSIDNFEDNTSDSDEYNTISSSLNDDDSKENDVIDSRDFERKSESKFRIVAAPINSTLKFFVTNVTSTESNIENSTLKSKPLLGSIDEIISESTTPKSHYPSLSQIYETWKRKGIEEKYEELSKIREGEHNLISREYSSEEKSDEASTELETSKRLNKKYILLVRKPTLSCNDSKSTNLYLKNKEYPWNDEELTALRPPPSLPQSKQVTYADFLLKNHNNSIKSSVTQKSGSTDTTIEENNIPPSIFVYHYYRQPHYRHQPTWKDLKNYILPSIEMIPPTRTSRSEYAHYNTEKRNGNNKPQYNFRREVLKNRMVFRINNETPEKRQKYLTVGEKHNYEKVPLKGVKNSYKSVNDRQLIGFRRKRNINNLLNKAPEIVEQVIDKEINMRFPKDQNNHDNDEEERYSSIEEIENVSEEKEKVEVEIPEFNFFEVNPSIKINKNNKDKIKKIENKFNHKKYPFYYNKEVLRLSPLKYIMDPQQIPHKTLGGSEFYDSRDKYLKCEEIDPDLSKVVPEKEEPMNNRDQELNLPRLQGLGDKILCYKAKYFDENPLDNPLFYEKEVEPPNKPEELNPFNFVTRISHLSINPEENVYRRVSRKPEIIDIRPLESRKNEIIDPNQYERNRAEQSTTWFNHAKKHRNRLKTTTASPLVPYQKLVYENVMDTIKNLTHLYKQYPSILNSRPSKVSSRLKKAKKSLNISQNQNRKKMINHFIYITTQTPDLSNDILSSDKSNHRKLKIFPYKTNKVTYRTRKITRPVRGVSNETIAYLKTVRVHKRQIDLSDLDLGESRTINVRNNTLRKRYKTPQNNTQLDQTTVSTKKIIYTIIDRAKNIDNQKSNGYGDFTTDRSTSTLRNEPKYTKIRRFDEDIYKIKTLNHSNNSKKIDERYDVHEENQDEQTSNPIEINEKENDDVSKNNSDDIENNSNYEQFSGSTSYDDESSSDDDNPKGYDKQKQSEEQVEQVERPHKSYIDSNSDDESNNDNSNNSENYHEDKSDFFTISDHEKDFERYSSRPLSPYQSFNDPKYAALGPRLNKPAFYHPPFESINFENHDEGYRDVSMSKEVHENKYGISKFMFPWHEDDESISEEMKDYKKVRRNYEFPWERRARLRAMREEIDRRLAEEHYPLESVRKFKKIYPWQSSFNHRFNKFGSNFWIDDDDLDSHVMDSEVYPNKQNYKKKINLKALNKKKEAFVEPRKGEQENLTDKMTTITTTILQIPATSAEFLSEENGSTTPTVLLTTSKEVFKLKPRSRRLGNIRKTGALIKDQSKLESNIVTSSTPKVLIKKTPRKRKLPDRNNNNNNNNRKFTMISTSTTTKPFFKKLSNYSIDGEFTTPTKRKIEHRSKVSKEKIITKTIFPSTEQIKGKSRINNDNNYQRNDDNNNYDNTQNNKMVQKLSIITNKNPEHIFQTKEIEENGKKNLFFTIIPNNRTQDMVINRINIDDLYKNPSNEQESKGIDKSLPLNDKLKLSERDTKKMMESISWISENYDV